ncbi:hypothetical protein AMTRI_Chr10g8280 [Amborella trichopoda]
MDATSTQLPLSTSPINDSRDPHIAPKPLTIRLSTSDNPNNKISPENSQYNSPSLISPPSSAFVSALQSPYISPRALALPENNTPSDIPRSPVSDDIPSSSYTPPIESDDLTDQIIKIPVIGSDPNAPRVSFSFPVPRISFRTSVSPSTNTKLRSHDVYIGYHGQNLNLIRFSKWLKSELELHGVACFGADRSKYSDSQSHETADRIICSATFGVVVITGGALLNAFTIEEIRIFSQRKNLVPVLFDSDSSEIAGFLDRKSGEKLDREWKEAIEGLIRAHEFKLEACDGNWRACISRTVGILKSKLGRKSIEEKEPYLEEFFFPRNNDFVGREKELQEIEAAFFGITGLAEEDDHPKSRFSGGSSRVSLDEEADTMRTRGRFISLEMRKCKEPTLEAWIEPAMELTNRGKSPHHHRHKHKKTRHGNRSLSRSEHVFFPSNSTVACISGASGIGKTELALEFAYRYSQRYKMVLWVGGEARYFRQSIMNLSVNLGLDVSAETQHNERTRITSFEDQEFEAFQRVKRELFRDVPYLLIIDNLESEKEWWDGRELHELIPNNTGATHVIITTRLSKVVSFKPMHLSPLPMAEALVLMEGKRKKGYPSEELDVLRRMGDELGWLSFGLGLIGALLSELSLSPTSLFETIKKVPINLNYSPPSATSTMDDQIFKKNPFLVRVLGFSFGVLEQSQGTKSLAWRMALAGGWFAPRPISATLLAEAAKKVSSARNPFHQWEKCLNTILCYCCNCCLASQTRRTETDSALLLVRLGLARRTKKEPVCHIELHEITQSFSRKRGPLPAPKAMVQGLLKMGNLAETSDHFWAACFWVFGFRSEPVTVQLKPMELVRFIKRIVLPLAIRAFATFSRCNATLELLKTCTNQLEEVEKSFVSQIQDWCHGSFCWKKKKTQSNQRVDEFVWQDVTLLKATLLETRSKLLLRGGQFDNGEELCRTCISIRTVMLGHHHAQTLAAQETLAKLVRFRHKI